MVSWLKLFSVSIHCLHVIFAVHVVLSKLEDFSLTKKDEKELEVAVRSAEREIAINTVRLCTCMVCMFTKVQDKIT